MPLGTKGIYSAENRSLPKERLNKEGAGSTRGEQKVKIGSSTTIFKKFGSGIDNFSIAQTCKRHNDANYKKRKQIYLAGRDDRAREDEVSWD